MALEDWTITIMLKGHKTTRKNPLKMKIFKMEQVN